MKHWRTPDSLGGTSSRLQVPVRLRIGIAPTPEFTLSTLSNLIEFLRHAENDNDSCRPICCTWTLLSHNTGTIRSSCGFELAPTKVFCNPAAFDYVIVHGGFLQSRMRVPDELYDYILEVSRRNVTLIGLCSGLFPLAELGLLNGRRCAVHFTQEVAIRKLFPEIIPVTTEPFVRDGPFITCPGGFSSLSLGMALVNEHCGAPRTNELLGYLMAGGGISDGRGPSAESRTPEMRFGDHRIVKAIELMHHHGAETLCIEDIARQVGITRRGLTRLFERHLGASPSAYRRTIRLKSARWMVVNTNRAIAQIASDCGFTDGSHLVVWFKRSFGTTPGRMRRTGRETGIG